MVDFSNLSNVNALYDEMSRIGRAITNLDAGAKITAMTIDGFSDDGNSQGPVALSTMNIDYPPQMAEAVKAALHQREDQISSELSSLGVTGAEPQPRGAVGAAAVVEPPRGTVGESHPPARKRK